MDVLCSLVWALRTHFFDIDLNPHYQVPPHPHRSLGTRGHHQHTAGDAAEQPDVKAPPKITVHKCQNLSWICLRSNSRSETI